MPMLLRTTIAAFAVALIAPASAAAAVTMGQSPPAAGTPSSCVGPPSNPSDDWVQAANTDGNPYTVPTGGGVITAWRTSTGSGPVKLRLFSLGGSGMTPVAESNAEHLTSTATSFPTRIPVAGGERLGLSVLPGASLSNCYSDTTGIGGQDTVLKAQAGPLGVDEPIVDGSNTTLLNVAVTLEPDADGDGYGDETQDGCPGDAAAHGPCPIDNAFTIGKKKPNAKNGTAKITVTVPGAGVIKLSGKDIASQREEKAAAGNGKLTLKPKGKAKKELVKQGKAKLKATITFTPTGGETSKQTTKLKLKLR